MSNKLELKLKRIQREEARQKEPTTPMSLKGITIPLTPGLIKKIKNSKRVYYDLIGEHLEEGKDSIDMMKEFPGAKELHKGMKKGIKQAIDSINKIKKKPKAGAAEPKKETPKPKPKKKIVKSAVQPEKPKKPKKKIVKSAVQPEKPKKPKKKIVKSDKPQKYKCPPGCVKEK